MKSRKLISMSAGAMFVALAASCSQEPLLPSNATMEAYTRSFIKEFGIPAPGHTYTTAVQAGLKVTTKKGGHVLVTAVVDGKEYRFANLDVPAGTHALPVRIPASVESLKISNGFDEQEVGINDIVDLDALGRNAGSRVLGLSAWSDGTVIFADDDKGAPILAFNPEDLLSAYFSKHPKNTGTGADGASTDKESTDRRYVGMDGADKAFDPDLPPFEGVSLWYGETALGSTYYDDKTGNVANTEYYVFPVWWRKNRYGTKDYKLYIHQCNNYTNRIELTFNQTPVAQSELGYSTDKLPIPFPELGYTTQTVDFTGGTYDKSIFTFDDEGTFDQAFPSTARTVVTTGKRMTFDLLDPTGNTYYGVGFCLESSDQNSNKTVSYSQPVWNSLEWDGKYFDQSITNLLFTTVSTMRQTLTGTVNLTGVNFSLDDIQLNENHDGDRLPFLLGFTSGPDSTTGKLAYNARVRDYTDLILLVIPINRIQTIFLTKSIPEPYPWTLAAEDLGATDDWDFNDVVIRLTDELVSLNSVNRNKRATLADGPLSANEVRLVTIEPVATGGTLPIYLTYTGKVKDMAYLPGSGETMFSAVNSNLEFTSAYDEGTFILGTEIHKWLGNPDYTKFINVGGTRQSTNAKKISLVLPNEPLAIGGGAYDNQGNAGFFSGSGVTTLWGYALLVDRGNQLQDVDAREDKGYVKIPATFTPDEDTYVIGRPSETGTAAPQMFIISGDWEWPTERKKISVAYPDFNIWITNPENAPDWYRPAKAERDYVTQKKPNKVS